MTGGKIVAISISPMRGQPLHAVDSIQAVAGKGLEGDRYYNQSGTFSKTHDASREVTLIEIEALEALKRDYGISMEPADSRRNIATQGVPLNHLVGKEFQVGEAVFKGIRLCEPCGHLEELTGQRVKAGLIHRGGLRAQILIGGTINKNDAILLNKT